MTDRSGRGAEELEHKHRERDRDIVYLSMSTRSWLEDSHIKAFYLTEG
jgi:hypothetical protein